MTWRNCDPDDPTRFQRCCGSPYTNWPWGLTSIHVGLTFLSSIDNELYLYYTGEFLIPEPAKLSPYPDGEIGGGMTADGIPQPFVDMAVHGGTQSCGICTCGYGSGGFQVMYSVRTYLLRMPLCAKTTDTAHGEHSKAFCVKFRECLCLIVCFSSICAKKINHLSRTMIVFPWKSLHRFAPSIPILFTI